MTLTPAYADDLVTVFECDHAALAAHLRETGVACDAMIVDAPYSARVHTGHDDGVDQSGGDLYQGRASKRTAACGRKPLSYSPWGVEEVRAFVAEWEPLVRGWAVSITDHVLGREWEAALQDAGRYVFAPLACVDSGSRVRLLGDGPPTWSVWAIVARPSTAEFVRWATIEARAERNAEPMLGAFVTPEGVRGGPHGMRGRTIGNVVGGKTVWLIRALVRDYSRAGDLIVDPTCGAGTLGVAVRYEGRRAILADKDPAAVECTIKRLRGERTKPTRDDFPQTEDQPSLFGKP